MVKTSLLRERHIVKNKNMRFVKIAYGVVVLAVVVIELFKFQELQNFINHYLVCGAAVAYVISAVAVVAGVLALPTLLGMKVSRTVRTVSIIANWVILFEWLSLPLWFIK